MISPPDGLALLIIFMYLAAGIISLVVAVAARVIQKRPLLGPISIAVIGIADIAFSFKYAQVVLPGFPGSPISTAEARPYFLLVAAVIFIVPITYYVSGHRELRQMREAAERQEAERRSAELMIQQLQDRIAQMTQDRIEQQRVFDELKRLIITNVGHELRMPVTIAMGYLQMLLAGEFGPVIGTPLGDPIGVAEETTRRMRMVIDRMLISLRDPFFERFDLAAVCRQVIVDPDIWINTRRKIEDVTLSIDVPEKLVIIGDVTMLRIAIIELLNNAIKFDSTAVSLVLLQDGDEVVIKVIDDGIGISRRYHKLIFQPLFQIRMDSERLYEGSGMGLAVVDEVAQIHDGFATVDSRLGRGATFAFTIPAKSQQSVVASEEVAADGKEND